VRRRLTGHALVAWLLWQATAPMAPDTPIEGATVVQSYDTKDACQKAFTIKRSTRNAMVHKGEATYEVFTCLPEGADPARTRFE
jgi:hypothetical protein